MVDCSISGQWLLVTNIRELGECASAGELVVYFVCNVHVLRLKTVFKPLWRAFVA